MELRLLGPLEARAGGRPVSLGAVKQRAVLAILALRPGAAVPADEIIEGLWGERLPATAPKMVQQYVSQLRRALRGGDGAEIVTRGRGYELRVEPDAVDVARFRRLVLGGAPHEALALWRGPALADLADEPFAGAEIRGLEDLRSAAEEAAVDLELAAGRHRVLVARLAALVESHPLREHLHAQLMLALYRSGRQAEALAAFRWARSLLLEQVGLEPGPELRELHARILRQDAVLAVPPPPGPRVASHAAAARRRCPTPCGRGARRRPPRGRGCRRRPPPPGA